MRSCFYFIILSALFLFSSCDSGEEPEVIEISLSVYTVDAPPEGGSYQVAVISNAAWLAEIDYDNFWWCAVEANRNNDTIYIEISRTESELPRQTRILVQNSSANGIAIVSDTIIIRQAGWNVPPEGVLVGSTIWAKYNVDAFGVFVENQRNAGQLYQFNDKTGYTAVESNGTFAPQPAWSSAPFANEWQPDNNPCPAGWRLPAQEEVFSLVKSGYQYNSAMKGFFFGADSRSATEEDNRGSVFLPMSGLIENGKVVDMFQIGRYWVQNGSTMNNDGSVFYRYLQFRADSSESGLAEFSYIVAYNIQYAFSVRCVRE